MTMKKSMHLRIISRPILLAMKIMMISFLLLSSCTKAKKIQNLTIDSIPPKLLQDREIMNGTVGPLPVWIQFDYVGNALVTGTNLTGELKRPVFGNYRYSGDTILLTLKEPNTVESDGIFELVSLKNSGKWAGKWTSYNGKRSFPVKASQELNAYIKSEYSGNIVGEWHCYKDTGENYDELKENGVLHFYQNAICKFEFYKDYSNDKSQLQMQYGHFTISKDTFKIYWLKNEFFKNKVTLFKLIRRTADSRGALVGIQDKLIYR